MKQPKNHNIYRIQFGGHDTFNVQAETMEKALVIGRKLAKERAAKDDQSWEPTSCVMIADWIFA